MKRDSFRIHPNVSSALAEGRPVVALESTIIAHGMPHPRNVETALEVESIVAKAGAVPATIGMLSGEVVVGLSLEEIEHFGTSRTIQKACERDLGLARARRVDAATTAGASMAIAAAAGIRVFVTGGIGGVGPWANEDFDVSADLTALAHHQVITICSGAKAFMNIAATLEVLETLRVPVVGYGSDDFPLFYSAHSGVALPWRVEAAAEVAAMFRSHLELGLPGGLLVGVPVPDDQALALEESRRAIERALAAGRRAGITGKALTPFLLAAIQTATGGRSLEANIALIRKNAQVGAEVAAALPGA